MNDSVLTSSESPLFQAGRSGEYDLPLDICRYRCSLGNDARFDRHLFSFLHSIELLTETDDGELTKLLLEVGVVSNDRFESRLSIEFISLIGLTLVMIGR